MAPAVDFEQLAARLANLETLFTHLERQVGELNLMVLAQSRQLEQVEKQLALLQSPPEGLEPDFEA